MGKFLGGIGSILILTAAYNIILNFLSDKKIIKPEAAAAMRKTAAFTVSAGLVYLGVLAYIRTCFKESTNIFDISAIFPCFKIREGIIGRLIFSEYAFTAELIAFAGVFVFLYFVEKAGFNSAEAMFFPGFFMMYSPSCISWIFAAAAVGLYLICKNFSVNITKMQPMIRLAVLSAELILNAAVMYTYVIGGAI